MIKTFLAKFKKIRFLLVFLAIGSYAFLSYSFTDNYFEISKNLDIFSTVLRELDLYYVDTIRPGDLVKTGIDAMLNSLDPYTDYIPESEIEDYKFMTTGEYGGIGALIQEDSDCIEIAEPYEGSPAAKAGLIAGDKIMSIDGIPTKGKNTADIGKLLKGQPGTSVKMLVVQPGANTPAEKTIYREVIKVDNVPYYGMVSNDIGYIRLNEFTEDAGKNVRNAFIELKKNPALKGVILDLRNNPGGLLNEAINVVNVFEPKGQLVVNTRGRMKEWNHTDLTPGDPVDTTIPIVILVNSGSASASEIVTGTMQDLDRGVIVGTRTYGKGLVQQTRPLSYDAQLKFTIAKYYIPSGRCIQALDYSHRNADGSVSKVPDSLKMAFRTRHGRVVYDGGGIDPDINIESPKYNVITIKLESSPQYTIFHYVTDYTLAHPTIASPDKFEISNAEYDKFVAYAKNQSFTYTTKSEQLLAQLKESTQSEKYYDDLKDAYGRIKDDIEEAKKNDFYKNKDEIKQVLESEIVSRYYYQKGRIQLDLRFDDEITKAISVLNNKTTYDSVLTTIAMAKRPFKDLSMTNWPQKK
jgi:carboxyl-terminal processing protease